ncbi:MAG: hypothetical protein AB2L24_31915 [Mangrovibacterium sp.]
MKTKIIFNRAFGIYIYFIFNILFSCHHEENSRVFKSALKQAGANKEELLKVIDHYGKNPADSLKLKAACFLIKNMPCHSWETGLDKYDEAFDSIARFPMTDVYKRQFTFELLLDSLKKIPPGDHPKVIRDIEILNADYLIENIDLAFEAWRKHPAEKRTDFGIFCNFILPYRNYNEPIESGTRRELMEEYHWVFDSLKVNVPLKRIADNIILPFKFIYLYDIRSKYPIPLSVMQFKKCRMGLCNDEVNYFVHLFRALGITSSEDFVPHYGNSYSGGHSFLHLQYGNEIYCEGNLLTTYREESIPKVYRRTYSKNITETKDTCLYWDVTQEYKATIDAEIDILFNVPTKGIIPSINVFAPRVQWLKVANGLWRNDKLLFKNIGTNVLYLAGYYHFGQLYAVNYPFSVLPDETVHFWKPSEEALDSVILLRKAGYKRPRDGSRKHWLDSLSNGIFQGANNPSFEHAQTLYKIEKLNSTHIQILPVLNKKPFQYVRFYANKRTSFLSLLEFIDYQGRKITGKVIKSNETRFNWQDGAFDDDPLTFSGGTDFSLGLRLDKPQVVSFIRIQSRNDDNHIRIGDTYELLYWDKKWKSLGIQTASDTLLVYHSVARNSLLWLRNLTRGNEENVFVMDENGQQHFLGFCNE